MRIIDSVSATKARIVPVVCRVARTFLGIARTTASASVSLLIKVPAKERRGAAIAGSIALHVFFLALMMWHPPRGLSGNGDKGSDAGMGESFGIDLVVNADKPIDAATIKEAETLELDEVETLSEAVDQPPLLSDIALLDIVPVNDVRTNGAPEALTAEAASQPSAGSSGGNGNGGQGQDDLWDAIAPCWRRLTGGEALPVKMTVTFSSNGGIAQEPIIARPDIPVTNAVIRSESLAMMALSECGRYAIAADRQNVEINFPSP